MDPRNRNNGWSNRPTQADSEKLWSVRRAPPRGELRALILSHDVTGRQTHFWHGRTQPCRGEACEACQAGQRARWQGWVAAIESGTAERILVEITALATKPLIEWFATHRTLRGAVLTLKRANSKPNARIVAQLSESAYPTDQLQRAPQIEPMLMRMWQLKPTATDPAEAPAAIRLAPTGTDGGTDSGPRDLQLD